LNEKPEITDSAENFLVAGKRQPLAPDFAEIATERARIRREKSPYRTFFLDFLPLAHLLCAGEVKGELSIDFSSTSVRVLLSGVERPAEWLREAVEGFAVQPAGNDGLGEANFFSSVLCSALGEWGGEVVIAHSTNESDPTVAALSLNSQGYQWGRVSLPGGSLLMQFFPQQGKVDMEALKEKLHSDFYHHCLEDRLLVTCDGIVYGLSGPAFTAAGAQVELSVGMWAVVNSKEEENRLAIGRLFHSTSRSAVERRELSYGTFRTGIIPSPNDHAPTRCRTVVYFDYDESPRTSRTVWSWNGVEVAHRDWNLQDHRLGVRVITETPQLAGWTNGCPELSLESLEKQTASVREDFQEALQHMVLEYNNYSPSIERSTLGCWFMLILSALALGGVAAPFMGSQVASGLSAVFALLLIGAEFRFRYARRYAVGRSFERLVARWEKTEDLWLTALLSPNGEKLNFEETP